MGVAVFLVGVAVTVVIGMRWSRARWSREQPVRAVDLHRFKESVRFDLEALRTIPALAPTLADVKWSKLKKQSPGNNTVGGVLVFGPQRLTWAPDDRARGFGVRSWQLPWTDVAGGSVRTATDTASAVLSVTIRSGGVLELTGVDEPAALAALRRLPAGSS